MVKKILKAVFKVAGLKLEISKIQKNSLELTMEGAIQRCVNRGLNVNTVIDVGASDGRWSKECMRFLPDAKYLLIEAQEEHKNNLEKFSKGHNNAQYVIAAAGKEEGKIYFDNTDLFGGVALENPTGENCIEVPVVSIDGEIKKRGLKPPYLIKLDTHGFELPILEGAQEAIKSAELIIIETYNYKLTKDSLKYFQMCDYMEKLGFSPVEMVDFMIRKYDHSFWQMDTFFIPSSRKEFSYNSFD